MQYGEYVGDLWAHLAPFVWRASQSDVLVCVHGQLWPRPTRVATETALERLKSRGGLLSSIRYESNPSADSGAISALIRSRELADIETLAPLARHADHCLAVGGIGDGHPAKSLFDLSRVSGTRLEEERLVIDSIRTECFLLTSDRGEYFTIGARCDELRSAVEEVCAPL